MKRGVLIFGILISILLIEGLSAGQFGGCTDSDNNNIFVRGITVNLTADASDICDGQIRLKEYYCEGDAIKLRYVNCLGNCNFGACRNDYFYADNATGFCRKSDGGINPTEIGTMRYTINSTTVWEFTDYCQTSSSLVEFYCTGGGMGHSAEIVECPLGCRYGACKSNPPILQIASCSELNGYSCNSSQICTQRWFTGATDVPLCCSLPCENYLRSCNEQRGRICQQNQFCFDYNWTSARDTNYCCLSTCIAGRTCNSAGGHICNSSTEYCSGNYLDYITDNPLCCSGQCKERAVPNCTCAGRECDNNECGESCGTCASGKICSNYNCVSQEQISENTNCTPNFECNIVPQICENSENQTVTCTDKNNCFSEKITTIKCGDIITMGNQTFGENKLLIKPNIIQNYWWVFILITAMVVLFVLLRKRKDKNKSKKKSKKKHR